MFIHLHSSQLSLPVEMQRFFLFFTQFSLHVRQNPLFVHVAHPFGHCIHSCRFLSPKYPSGQLFRHLPSYAKRPGRHVMHCDSAEPLQVKQDE